MNVSRPLPNEFAPYFNRYIDLVAEADFAQVMAGQPAEFHTLLGALSPEKETYRYAEGKWSIRQVLGHVTDTERVFGYRALCIARGETASLHSFEQDDYAAQAGHDRVPLTALLEEFCLVRRGHLALFRQLDEAAWTRSGTVNHHPLTVRSLGYMIAGHARHHLGVLKERYAAGLGG